MSKIIIEKKRAIFLCAKNTKKTKKQSESYMIMVSLILNTITGNVIWYKLCNVIELCLLVHLLCVNLRCEMVGALKVGLISFSS